MNNMRRGFSSPRFSNSALQKCESRPWNSLKNDDEEEIMKS